jgi:dienelactone hydrolase
MTRQFSSFSKQAADFLPTTRSLTILGLCLFLASVANGQFQTTQQANHAVSQDPLPEDPVAIDWLDAYPELAVGSRFMAKDSLDCGHESNADARQCLEDLAWNGEDFQVAVEPATQPKQYDRLIRFTSPKPSGTAPVDRVALQWYVAKSAEGQVIKAPAIVVVHESGSGMTVGQMISRGLRNHGFHTFMLQMPGYGVRRAEEERDVAQFLPALKQAIADVRRARDAVSVLPWVDNTLIGVQGTSLGGFVVATVSGLDHGFDRSFILLAGGDLQRVIFNGHKDAAEIRQRLEAAGASRDQIIQQLYQIEPLRLASRVRAQTTWLFLGQLDDVVPPECSRAWSRAVGLSSSQHIEMPVDHYSGILLMPKILDDLATAMRQSTELKP